MTEEAASRGYAETTVTAITERAAVSRSAFYHLFSDKEECMLAAVDAIAGSLKGELADALERHPPDEAHRIVLAALGLLADERPSAFLLATHEAMAAGPRGLERRNAFVEELSRLLESRWAELPATGAVPDLPALLVIGGVIRYLGMALRHGSLDWQRDQTELEAWIATYCVQRRARRWRDLEPDRTLEPPAAVSAPRIGAPRRLPRRGEVSPAAYVAIERERVIRATAELVSEQGYDATAVSEIAALAGVSRESFYRHFDGKRAALDAAATYVFEQTMAAMGGAYFAASTPWPERIWRSAWALTAVLSSVPSLTHTAFIEAFASDPATARRADELFLGFTIFLTEGAEIAGDGTISRIFPRAIAGAMVELGVNSAARGATADLPGLVPLGFFLTTAPYIGAETAAAFVMNQKEP